MINFQDIKFIGSSSNSTAADAVLEEAVTAETTEVKHPAERVLEPDAEKRY